MRNAFISITMHCRDISTNAAKNALLYYTTAKSNNEVNLNEPTERIQRASAVNQTGMLCMLCALQTEMIFSFQHDDIKSYDIKHK